MDSSAVSAAYSAVADLYIEMFGTSEKVHADDLAFIRRHLGQLPGPVVDAGCGPGHLTNYLHGLGADVKGIDIVPTFIKRAEAEYPGVQFELRSLTALEDPMNPLAGLLAWYSLIHFTPPRLATVIEGLRRAIVPGGTLVIGLIPGEEVTAFDHRVTTAYFWPSAEARALLDRSGFDVIETLERAGDGSHRPHLAIAAKAVQAE